MKDFLLLSIIFFHQIICAQHHDSLFYEKIHEAGAHMISLEEGYKLFSQKTGTGPVTILFIHGGPGNTHEYFEVFKDVLSPDQYTLIFYDQLGSYYSDQPDDTTLWNIPRFVGEIEQVRQFYDLRNFYLLGHSWGGILAMEYALKYPELLKGLIISNMSYSNETTWEGRLNRTLQIVKELDLSAQTLEDIKLHSVIRDTVEARIIRKEFAKRHLMRIDPMPEPYVRNVKHLKRYYWPYLHDKDDWNIWDKLDRISMPTLLIGARNDFISMKHIRKMKRRIEKSQLFISRKGSHFTFWDDGDNYFEVLQRFINSK